MTYINTFKKMQETILNVWEKSWPLLVRAYEFFSALWQKISPTLQKVVDFFATIYVFVKNIVSQAISYTSEQFIIVKPIVLDFFGANKLLASIIAVVILIILYIWIWTLRYAKKNELIWRKTWVFIIFILGPLGALIYYLARKRPLEREKWQHEKVVLSFFTPMSGRTNNSKKDN